jgi:cytochrome c551/c552
VPFCEEIIMKHQMFGVIAATGFAFAVSAAELNMPPAATQLGCVACHAMDKKLVGPSWKDIAEKYSGHKVKKFKYNGKEYPLIEGLVMKVSNGGSGNWGAVPMPPNDPKGLHRAEITQLVKFEQSLAKK